MGRSPLPGVMDLLQKWLGGEDWQGSGEDWRGAVEATRLPGVTPGVGGAGGVAFLSDAAVGKHVADHVKPGAQTVAALHSCFTFVFAVLEHFKTAFYVRFVLLKPF